MDVFHMTYVRNATFHKLKNDQKHPVYEDKGDTRRKVVKVKKTLIWSFMFRTILQFRYMLYYCRPTMNLYKKTLLKY